MDENKTRIVNPSREGKVTVKERELQIPNELKIIAVQNDNLVENVYFEIPKTFDEVNDLSTFELRVNWLNANGDADSDAVEIVSTEGETIVFKWNPTEFLTKYEGTVKISIFAIHEDGRKWNSAIAELTVLKGIVLSDEIVKKFPNVIEDLLKRVSYLENHNAQMQKTKVYDTTIEMIADEYLKIGDKVKTYGYERLNDGGEAEFIISESSNDLQLSLKNGLFAKLVYTDTVYASQLDVKNGDMTLLINDLFNKIRSNTKVIFDKQLDITVDFSKLPNNPYPKKRAFIDLLNKDNVYIDFGNSKFSILSNNFNNYVMCYVDSCNNFSCENGEFVGDRKSHQYNNPQKPSVSDEFGHGFTIWASKKMEMNYTINNMNIHDFTGDGIISSNAYQNSYGLCTVKNSHIHHMRRNGITILDTDKVVIENCYIHDIGDSDGISGKAPKAGIDLEPNYNYTNTINDILITNCLITKCQVFGVVHSRSSTNVRLLKIFNNTIKSSINVDPAGTLILTNNHFVGDGVTWVINCGEDFIVKHNNFNVDIPTMMTFREYDKYESKNVLYDCKFKGKNYNSDYKTFLGNFVNCYFENVKLYANNKSNYSFGKLEFCTFKNCYLNIDDFYLLQSPVKFCNFIECKSPAVTSTPKNKFFNCCFDTRMMGSTATYKNCSFSDEM